jgi:hypothetical protein
MWEVDNRTPFAALGYFARDRAGLEHWVVAIRARFLILDDGFNRLAEDQGSIRLRPEYLDDAAEELINEADLSPFRPRTDFLLSGEITAPDEQLVNKVHVGFELERSAKIATAYGARRLRMHGKSLKLEGSEPLSPFRLSWRNSLGGADIVAPDNPIHPANPIGSGWTGQWPHLPAGAEIQLPRIESREQPIGLDALPDPFGFGPIQPNWAPRAAHAGTYDDDWRKYEAPLPPSDFSDAFFQAAPDGQIFDLKGGERGKVFGLHPQGPYMFRLPQIIIENTIWIGRQTVNVRPRLISVNLNGSAKTIEMVWNAATPCPFGDMSVSGSRVHVKQMAGVMS